MELTYRDVEPGDGEAVLAARNEVLHPALFGDTWRWAFTENPNGRRAFGAFEGDAARAHWSWIPQRMWIAGKERTGGEVVEGFEAQSGRGLYALTAQALIEAHGGPKGSMLLWRWPDAGEAKVLGGLLGFETIRTDVWLVREVGRGASPGDSAGLRPIERFDEQARWLWDRCAGAFGASVIRDADFLNWRFVDRPGAAFVRLGVHDAEGVLRGYVVYAPPTPRTVGRGWIVDWLCPPDEPEVGEALLGGALAQAAADGARWLATLLVPWSPWFETFQRRGFVAEAPGRYLLARSFIRKFDDLWLRDGWWYTLADSADLG